MNRSTALVAAALTLLVGAGCRPASKYDVVIRGGTVYDGSGTAPFVADVAIQADTIAAIGDLSDIRGANVIDASGLVLTPGFINMLSWATESLIVDPRSMSDIYQGVTLEVFGEGVSMGPLNEAMRDEAWGHIVEASGSEAAAIKLVGGDGVPWTTLDEYLQWLVDRGVAPNIASYVGATTVRQYVIGNENRGPDPEELQAMKNLVREAMQDGALGVGSSLIYAPAFFANTDELIALASAAAEFGGLYASHLRSEGNRLLEAARELIEIAREASVRAHIWHIKAAGAGELAQDGYADRAGRFSQAGGTSHQRRYVYLYGRSDRPQCGHASTSAGRGLRSVAREIAGPGRAGPVGTGHADTCS